MSTPHTLDDLVMDLWAHGGNDAKCRAMIRDYLSQKFQVAMFKATPEVERALENLWVELTGEVK